MKTTTTTTTKHGKNGVTTVLTSGIQSALNKREPNGFE
jgi:hypothetical protein